MINNKLKDKNKKWSNVLCGEVFSFIRTYAVSRDNLNNGLVDDGSIGNIHYGDLHSTYKTPSINLNDVQVPLIKDSNFNSNKDDFLLDGDLIMADASEDYEGIGVTVSVHGLKNKKVVGGLHTFVLRDTKGLTVEYYRQYIFRNYVIRNKLQKMANGVSVYGISKTALSKILLPIPPLLEQSRIVSVLETWDKAIEGLRRKIEIKKNIKKGLMQRLLTGKVRLNGFDDKWKVVKLGDVCSRIKRRNTEGNDNVLTISAQNGLINQELYFKKKIAFNNLEKYTLLLHGDFAYNKSYSNGYPMGAIKRLNIYKKGIVSSLYITFEPKKINSDFLQAYFDLGLYNKEIGLIAQEGARNHGLLNIGIDDFFQGDLKVPCLLEEQNQIANIIHKFSDNILLLEAKLVLLKEQKKYLLNNLITGAIRTPEGMKT